jgi:glutamate racemase
MKKSSSILHPPSSILRVGVFDSGLGGLTVLSALIDTIKGAEFYYIADTVHAPYGEKSPKQILQYSLDITEHFLKEHQIDALVVACNTATSAAIATLREHYPMLIIVGTEPAIKPAIEWTRSGAVGVLATPATLKGDKSQKLADTLMNQKPVKLYEQACPGFVEHIENGTLHTPESHSLLQQWLAPMKEGGVDTIVLGCTHYPLAKAAIAQIMGEEVTFLDAGEAIAKRLLTLLEERGHTNSGHTTVHIGTTGDIDKETVKNLISKPTTLTKLTINPKISNF